MITYTNNLTAAATPPIYNATVDIQLIRYKQGTDSTLSKIIIAGLIRGFVLEDTDRFLTQNMSWEEIAKQKVWGKTCIPTGRYDLAMTYSVRFKRVMPQLLDVPGFEGIGVHVGN